MKACVVPNALTASRVVLAGVMGWTILEHYWLAATIVLLAAMLTDAFDGTLARHFRCDSPRGATYDEVADGIMVTVLFVALWWVDLWPTWLGIVQIAWTLVLQYVRRFDRNSKWFWMHRHGYYLLPATYVVVVLAAIMVLTWQWTDLERFFGWSLFYGAVTFLILFTVELPRVKRFVAGPYPEV